MASPENGRILGQFTDPIYVVVVSGTLTSGSSGATPTVVSGTVAITGTVNTSVLGNVSSQLTSGSVTNPLYVVLTLPPSGSSTNPTNRLTVLESGLHVISGAVTGSREVYLIEAMNNSSSTLYLQIFNTGSLPAAGAVPRYTFAVPSFSPFSRDLSAVGGELYTTNGFSFAWSTGSEQLGQPTAALCRNVFVNVWYR